MRTICVGYNWKKGRGTLLLLASIALAYIIELAWGAPGNDAVLLKLGAMPDSGGLHGQYWRLITAGFLHSNNMHILLNAMCLFLGGSIVEHRVGSAATILLFTVWLTSPCIATGEKRSTWPCRSTFARERSRDDKPVIDPSKA